MRAGENLPNRVVPRDRFYSLAPDQGRGFFIFSYQLSFDRQNHNKALNPSDKVIYKDLNGEEVVIVLGLQTEESDLGDLSDLTEGDAWMALSRYTTAEAKKGNYS